MWKDLLTANEPPVIVPWLGGRHVRRGARSWAIHGKLPQDHGWYTFKSNGRALSSWEQCENQTDVLGHTVTGYLVGDHLVPDNTRPSNTPTILLIAEHVHLIDEGLDRFVRVRAGRLYENGPLVYIQPEMPLGPEDEVTAAFLDKQPSVNGIKGVHPGLQAAFELETWYRNEAEKRRLELERLRREEEERRALEIKREAMRKKLGDGQGRREVAAIDFVTAATAALSVSGAVYLDHRRLGKNETAVKFRFEGRRFECTCDNNLRIVQAGICLNDYATRTSGDTRFTLESLPAVIREAILTHRLVVFRHV